MPSPKPEDMQDDELRYASHLLRNIDRMDGPTIEQIRTIFPKRELIAEFAMNMLQDLLDTMVEEKVLRREGDRYYPAPRAFLTMAVGFHRTEPDHPEKNLKVVLYELRAMDGPTLDQMAKRWLKDGKRELFDKTNELMVASTIYEVRDGRYYPGKRGMELMREPWPSDVIKEAKEKYNVLTNGKDPYKDLAIAVLQASNAQAVVMYVHDGTFGSALALTSRDPTIHIDMPGILESMAKDIRSGGEPVWVSPEVAEGT